MRPEGVLSWLGQDKSVPWKAPSCPLLCLRVVMVGKEHGWTIQPSLCLQRTDALGVIKSDVAANALQLPIRINIEQAYLRKRG